MNVGAVGALTTTILVARGEEFGGEWVFCAWSVSRVSAVIGPLLELKGKDASSSLFRILDFNFSKVGHFLWATCPSPSFPLPNFPSYSCHPFPALGPHDDGIGGQRASIIICMEPLGCTPPFCGRFSQPPFFRTSYSRHTKG